LVTTCGELKPATGKTVRASSPYPPVLEPGIEEIGWLFGALKVQGLTTELGNADLTDTQIPGIRRRSGWHAKLPRHSCVFRKPYPH
jgi:hypothetical protein